MQVQYLLRCFTNSGTVLSLQTEVDELSVIGDQRVIGEGGWGRKRRGVSKCAGRGEWKDMRTA